MFLFIELCIWIAHISACLFYASCWSNQEHLSEGNQAAPPQRFALPAWTPAPSLRMRASHTASRLCVTNLTKQSNRPVDLLLHAVSLISKLCNTQYSVWILIFAVKVLVKMVFFLDERMFVCLPLSQIRTFYFVLSFLLKIK